MADCLRCKIQNGSRMQINFGSDQCDQSHAPFSSSRPDPADDRSLTVTWWTGINDGCYHRSFSEFRDSFKFLGIGQIENRPQNKICGHWRDRPPHICRTEQLPRCYTARERDFLFPIFLGRQKETVCSQGTPKHQLKREQQHTWAYLFVT